MMSTSLFKAMENLPAAVSDWTEDDVAQFLEDIGLHEYADAFVHERIRGITLAELTPQDVIELGITRMGDRKFFFKALEHVLQVDEVHHSDHVHHVVNTPELQKHLERRSTMGNVELESSPPKMKRRSSATSFDALSRQRRSDGGYLGISDEMMQPVNVVVRKKSGFTAVQQQQQLQEMQLKLLKQQQEMERQKFQMEHQQQNLRESVRPHSAQAAGRGGTKRRMSGPPIIFHNPPSVDGGSIASDSVGRRDTTPKMKRRAVPNLVITTPEPDSRELGGLGLEPEPELLDTPHGLDDVDDVANESLVQPQQQQQQQLHAPILHNNNNGLNEKFNDKKFPNAEFHKFEKVTGTTVSWDTMIENKDDIPKSAVGK
ncbi:hypothetical protein TL16_g06066 [Triparma laevis f. inornata]|uniref:SAM domain-containing protein n=1 Tax=Triparma laevis f. inornata TaxID=1714386 RepID=A0A9W7EE23_9STRA|nr:hypothetical protein TL16_g06066 [Triparma laevis f. inornata]